MKFSITYHRTQDITATYPANDLLAIHAITAFGFVLNDAATWDRSLSGPQFAEVIATMFDVEQLHIAIVIGHLRMMDLLADEQDPCDDIDPDAPDEDDVRPYAGVEEPPAPTEQEELDQLRGELQAIITERRAADDVDYRTMMDARVFAWFGVTTTIDKVLVRDSLPYFEMTAEWLQHRALSPKALRLLELLRAEENRTRANG